MTKPQTNGQAIPPMPIAPVPTNISWSVASQTLENGTTLPWVVLTFDTPQGSSVFFMEPDRALEVANGLAGVAQQSKLPRGLIVPDVDVSEVLRSIDKPKGEG